MKVSDDFERLKQGISDYKHRVERALKAFCDAKAQLKSESAKFKDERGYYDSKIAPLQSKARKEIMSARDDMNRLLKNTRVLLGKELASVMTQVPGESFVNLLRIYADFGIKPNKLDVSFLIDKSYGNSLALRGINAYLEKAESDYRVSVPPFEQYETDLKRLECLQDMLWTGLSHPMEAREVFDGVRRDDHTSDGKQQNGLWSDAGVLITSSQSFDMMVNELFQNSEAWQNNIETKIIELTEGIATEYTPAITKEHSGIQAAREAGKATARNGQMARQVAEMYSEGV